MVDRRQELYDIRTSGLILPEDYAALEEADIEITPPDEERVEEEWTPSQAFIDYQLFVVAEQERLAAEREAQRQAQVNIMALYEAGIAELKGKIETAEEEAELLTEVSLELEEEIETLEEAVDKTVSAEGMFAGIGQIFTGVVLIIGMIMVISVVGMVKG